MLRSDYDCLVTQGLRLRNVLRQQELESCALPVLVSAHPLHDCDRRARRA